MLKWLINRGKGAIYDMLIYEHSISRKKHPSHEPCSHAKTMRHRTGRQLFVRAVGFERVRSNKIAAPGNWRIHARKRDEN